MIVLKCLVLLVTLLHISSQTYAEETVVIKTPVRNYDEPTLDEYQKCFESTLFCKRDCETAANRTACESDCPVCPILIKQNVLVQGINDSSYIPPSSMSVNTTNIIRLTNEIHNIIEQQMPNITTLNENSVNVHTNHSESFGKHSESFGNLSESSGNPSESFGHVSESFGNFSESFGHNPKLDSNAGEFGMGSNVNGSCCLIIRPSRNCDRQHTTNSLLCRTKRRLVCGANCKARVMYAKSVLDCIKQDDGNESCTRHMEYVPFEERKVQQPTPKCYYVPRWPYVSCLRERPTAAICRRCLQLPYGYVLIEGLPPQCIHCLTESPYFAAPWQNQGHAAFDLYTLQNEHLTEADWQKNTYSYEKYFSDDDIYNVPTTEELQRRRKRQNMKNH